MPGSTTTSGGGASQGKLIFTSTWANAGPDSRAANAAASRFVLMPTTLASPPGMRYARTSEAFAWLHELGGSLHTSRCDSAEVLQRAAETLAQRHPRRPAQRLLRQRRIHRRAHLFAGLGLGVLRRLPGARLLRQHPVQLVHRSLHAGADVHRP